MNKRNIASLILLCAAIIFIVAAGVLWFLQHRAAVQAEKEWQNLRPQTGESFSSEEASGEIVETETTGNGQTSSGPSEELSASPEENPVESAEAIPLVENPYKEAFLQNSDMTAWLKVEDTNIDYPVMWTPEDEEYYLYRDFNGKDNNNGCLLLDTDSCTNPLTTNLIIHGHNMKSGAMFGKLTAYEKESYYKEHKFMTLYTKEMQRNYEVIAVFRSQVYKKSDQVFKFYKFFQADTEEEFEDFYNNIKNLSIYDTGVTASFGDHFLTLSTCTYHVKNGRFVVIAKEIEEGEHYLPVQDETP